MVTFLMTVIAAGVGAYLSTYLRENWQESRNQGLENCNYWPVPSQ
ncbi:hypothetical protein [Paraburkholderia franconis]|nr:hypothetical protein [Paraburkholderia franconis]